MSNQHDIPWPRVLSLLALFRAFMGAWTDFLGKGSWSWTDQAVECIRDTPQVDCPRLSYPDDAEFLRCLEDLPQSWSSELAVECSHLPPLQDLVRFVGWHYTYHYEARDIDPPRLTIGQLMQLCERASAKLYAELHAQGSPEPQQVGEASVVQAEAGGPKATIPQALEGTRELDLPPSPRSTHPREARLEHNAKPIPELLAHISTIQKQVRQTDPAKIMSNETRVSFQQALDGVPELELRPTPRSTLYRWRRNRLDAKELGIDPDRPSVADKYLVIGLRTLQNRGHRKKGRKNGLSA